MQEGGGTSSWIKALECARASLIRDAVKGLRHQQHQHHCSLYHTLERRGERGAGDNLKVLLL